MKKLTKRQSDIYNYIDNFIREYHYSPTVREICEGVGLKSTSSVVEHLIHLKSKGIIDYQPESPRTIRITMDVDEEAEEYRREYGNSPSIKTVNIPLWMESYAYDKKWDLSELLKEAIQKRISGK